MPRSMCIDVLALRAEGLKALFCGLPFGLSRHATEEVIEHEERRISQCRFEPDHGGHQHRTPA
jgi:hypothetical protein